jgi:E3 ubiquitin-protein ligase UBR1
VNIAPEYLADSVKPLCITFLKRTCLFLYTLGVDPQRFSPSVVLDMPDDFDLLLQLLHLPALNTLFASTEALSFIKNWLQQLKENIGSSSIVSTSYLPRLAYPRPTKLIDLPATFQELVLKFMGVKCPTCQTVPKQGGICLLCGMLCCVASQCCFKNERGECARVCNYLQSHLIIT